MQQITPEELKAWLDDARRGCHHGSRSFQVALFLERRGFARVYNLQGGVDAWARAIDPSLPID